MSRKTRIVVCNRRAHMSETRTAVLLVAGIGSRLRPLTDDRPKALMDIGGETILGRALRILGQHGVERIVLATGYREDAVRAALAGVSPRGRLLSQRPLRLDAERRIARALRRRARGSRVLQARRRRGVLPRSSGSTRRLRRRRSRSPWTARGAPTPRA